MELFALHYICQERVCGISLQVIPMSCEFVHGFSGFFLSDMYSPLPYTNHKTLFLSSPTSLCNINLSYHSL